MQIKAYIGKLKTVLRKIFNRKLKKMHIVRFLADHSVRLHQLFVYFKEARMGEPVLCVFLLRKRAAEIQIDLAHAFLGYVSRQIFRRAFHKAQIGKVLFFSPFAAGDDNIRHLFNRYDIFIRISLCEFNGQVK